MSRREFRLLCVLQLLLLLVQHFNLGDSHLHPSCDEESSGVVWKAFTSDLMQSSFGNLDSSILEKVCTLVAIFHPFLELVGVLGMLCGLKCFRWVYFLGIFGLLFLYLKIPWLPLPGTSVVVLILTSGISALLLFMSFRFVEVPWRNS